jgi:NAD(P)-dependent dehydrogenase (short-subunit alcohol dehydrogenase family)
MIKEEKQLFSLKNKVVVITGALGLLGKRHAEVIASYGGNPILLDLKKSDVELMANELNEKYSVDASGFEVDITNESEVKDNAIQLFKKYGKIDGLINNAANNPKVEGGGTNPFSRLEVFSIDSWNKDLAVGLTGAFLCSKHYGYLISQNSEGGSIINISSDLGLIAPDQRLYSISGIDDASQPVKPVTYSVVKTGLIGLTRYIATYWSHQNVRCNAICPGGVENGQDEDFLKNVSSRIPLNRLAKDDEYQTTLLWMLSDGSKYLNGAIVAVDGGRTAW